MERPQMPQRFYELGEAAAKATKDIKTYSEILQESIKRDNTPHGPQHAKRQKDRLWRRMR